MTKLEKNIQKKALNQPEWLKTIGLNMFERYSWYRVIRHIQHELTTVFPFAMFMDGNLDSWKDAILKAVYYPC